MTTSITVKDEDFELEDADASLVLAIQELTTAIRRIAENG